MFDWLIGASVVCEFPDIFTRETLVMNWLGGGNTEELGV